MPVVYSLVHNAGTENQIVNRVQVLDLKHARVQLITKHSVIIVLLSFGLIVQKGKFSAGTLDLVRILKKVDFLEK